MSLHGLRDAVVATLKTALPALPSIEAHAGRFTPEEVKRAGAQTPALRVVVVDVPQIEASNVGTADVDVLMGVYVVTRDTPASPRDKAALATVTALTTIVPENRWGLDYAERPEGMRADNLYSGDVDKLGLALWAMTWLQTIRVKFGPSAGVLDDLKTFVTDYHLPPLGDPPGAPAATDKTEGLES